MAQQQPPEDQMNYEAMAQDALRGVIKAALRKAVSLGQLPGEHHFYITFRTKAPGVSGPSELLAKYPDEMTIVLQHQFWDLQVEETLFQVTLKFGGQPKRLVGPYAAVTRFYDPSVQFLLQFEAAEPSLAPVVALEPASTPALKDDSEPAEATEETGPKVVSLDQFRKK